MATGFHGAHVIIGTIFLLVCLIRAMRGAFTPQQHFGFEAAAWYWHFVDVVWLFLFACIYVWGAGPIAGGRRLTDVEPSERILTLRRGGPKAAFFASGAALFGVALRVLRRARVWRQLSRQKSRLLWSTATQARFTARHRTDLPLPAVRQGQAVRQSLEHARPLRRLRARLQVHRYRRRSGRICDLHSRVSSASEARSSPNSSSACRGGCTCCSGVSSPRSSRFFCCASSRRD